MGFEFNRTILVLEFTDDDMHGLEVKSRAADTGTFLALLRLAGMGVENLDPAQVEEMLTGFARVLVSWNLEIDGEPIPADLDGLKRLEFANTFRIIAGWIRSTAGVSAPLAQRSSDGAPSEMLSIPMVPLSGNRAS